MWLSYLGKKSYLGILRTCCFFLLLQLFSCQTKDAPSLASREPATSELFELFEKAKNIPENEPDSAVFYFRMMEQRSKDLNYDLGVGIALANIGQVYFQKGENDRAIQYYKMALPHYLKAKTEIISALYISMGNSYTLQGNFNMANRYYFSALQSALKYKPKDNSIAAAYANLAGVQWSLGQFQKSLYYAEQAEYYIRKTKTNNYEMAAILNNKGDALSGLGNYEQAFTVFNRGLEIAKAAQSEEVQSSLLSSLGGMMLAQNKNKEAVVYLKEALQKETKNPYYGFVLPRYKLGLAYYRLGECDKAQEVLLAAFNKIANTGQLNESINAHATLALIYQAKHDYQKAFEQQQIVLILKDSLLSKEKIHSINEMETKFRTAQKDKEIAEKKLQIAKQENKLSQKNIWIGGVSLLTFLLAGFFVSRNRLNKQKQAVQSNQIRILEQQQALTTQEKEIDQLKAIMQGEERERVRIAQELHDGIVSHLMAVRLHFKAALQNGQGQIPNLPDFHTTMEYLDDATKELRKTAHNLMPETVLQGGLVVALHSFCKKMEVAEGTKIYFQPYGSLNRMHTDIELSLYRIVQALVQNAIKHAAANYILVQLDITDDILSIIVEDNGVGCASISIDNNKGMGLRSVATRVKALKGTMDIISTPEKGTTVNMEFTINTENAII